MISRDYSHPIPTPTNLGSCLFISKSILFILMIQFNGAIHANIDNQMFEEL